MSENNNRYFRIFFLDLTCKGKCVNITYAKHLNNQVDPVIFKDSHRLPGCISMDKNRWITEVQRYIFIEDLLINASVLFKHKEIIAAANNQNFAYPVLHQKIKRSIRKVIC